MTGGSPRDSLQSHAIWNGPAVTVDLAGGPYVTLPAFLPGPEPLTFSGTAGEVAFIMLIKRCGALQNAANRNLWALCDPEVPLDVGDTQEAARTAAHFLRGVRTEMRAFVAGGEFTAEFFLDVLRQYACP